jgi:hypothetical protein
VSDTAKIVNRIIERIIPFHQVQITDTTSSGGVWIEVLGREYLLSVKLDGSISAIDQVMTDQDKHCRLLVEGLLNNGVKRDDAGNLEVVK